MMDFEILCNILNFLMGMLTMYLLRLGWSKYHNRLGIKSPSFQLSKRGAIWTAALVIILGSLFTGVQSYQTDKAVRDLTLETQRCYREFSEALQARSAISMENELIARQQRAALVANDEAMLVWLGQLLSPPAEIAALPPTDQRRRDFNTRVSHEFNAVMIDSRRIVNEARESERQTDERRKQHPLPEPTCGLE